MSTDEDFILGDSAVMHSGSVVDVVSDLMTLGMLPWNECLMMGILGNIGFDFMVELNSVSAFVFSILIKLLGIASYLFESEPVKPSAVLA